MVKKITIAFFLMMSFISSLTFATTPATTDDVLVAVGAIKDTAFSVSSLYISDRDLALDGITLTVDSETNLPQVVVLKDVDLSTFLPYFPLPSYEPNSLQALLAQVQDPLGPLVRKRLVIHNWKKGEAIMNGVVMVQYQTGATFSSMISNALYGMYPRVGLGLDITITGKRVSTPLTLDGVFLLSADSNKVLDITPIQLTINGEEMDVSL